MAVAFESGATNLVPNDFNGVQDVFVHDRGGRSGAGQRTHTVGPSTNAILFDGTNVWVANSGGTTDAAGQTS